MERNLQLKKIGCSNCGAELIFDPGTQMTNCNFCGSQFEIEEAKDEEIVKPDGILPFKISKKEYEDAVFSWLSEGDYTPDDILNSTIFESVNGVYLPMWFYKGRYNGNWSASSGYDRMETYFGRNSNGELVEKIRKVTDWRPSSGQCSGQFDVLAFAGIGKGINSDIAAYAHGTTFNRGELKPYDPKYTMGFNLIEYTVDEYDTWDVLGKSQVDSLVEAESKARIPGDRYKDFYVDSLYDKETPLRNYIPFWITNYKYAEKDFHVYMDGTSTQRINGVRPEDKARKAEAKKKFYNGHIGSVVTIIIFFLMVSSVDSHSPNYDTWIGVLIFSLLGTLVLYGRGQYQKTKMINASKERRQQILKKKLDPSSEELNTVSRSDRSDNIKGTEEKSNPARVSSIKNKKKWVLSAAILGVVAISGAVFYFFSSNNFESQENLMEMSNENITYTKGEKIMNVDEEIHRTSAFKIKIKDGKKHINIRSTPEDGYVIDKVSENEIYTVSDIFSSETNLYLLNKKIVLTDVYSGEKIEKPKNFKLSKVTSLDDYTYYAEVVNIDRTIYEVYVQKSDVETRNSKWFYIDELDGWIYSEFCIKLAE